jgi:hypothetical protein
MANGDKPPGGVVVTVTSPDVNETITIDCHSVDDANDLAQKIVTKAADIKEEYGKH